MFVSWLRERMSPKAPAVRRRGRTASPPRPRFRPQVESLESRALLSAGALDPAFGTGGKVVTDFGGTDAAQAVATEPDGKIVVVGYIQPLGVFQTNFLVARYNKDGSLDQSFGSGGSVTTQFTGLDAASGVVIEPDGKIVVAGGSFDPATFNSNMVVARYNDNGSLDNSFGSGGQIMTNFGVGLSSYASGIALQHDGRIVVVGYAQPNFFNFTGDFALARYNKDGSLDQGFGSGGLVTTSFGGFDGAKAVALQPDGRIVVAGITEHFNPGIDSNFALARYNKDGSLDQGFGLGGQVTTDLGGFDFAQSLAVQPDGAIVVAGSTENFRPFAEAMAVVRYNKDGSLDQSFGRGGLVITNFGGLDILGTAVAIQPNGAIVVAGFTIDPSTSDQNFAVARFNPDGSPDQSFGTGGLVTTDFGGQEGADGVALQSNGDIVVAGFTFAFGSSKGNFALAEYTAR